MQRTDQKAIVKLLSPYAALFPNCKLTAESWVLYARSLDIYPLAVLQAAMEYAVRGTKFFPTVSEICEAADIVSGEVTNKGLPTPDEAWQEVQKLAKTVGTYGTWQYSCPEVEQAAKNFGVYELSTLELRNVNTARAQFMRIYQSVLERKRQKKQVAAIIAKLPTTVKAQLASVGGDMKLLGVAS